jgi:AcrR family transcriptional regulator
LQEAPKRRVTPLDALSLATKKWLNGERLDIGRLAQELQVGRATLFRWVGTREQLYVEVLRRVYARQRKDLLESAQGRGLALLEDVVRRNLEALAGSTALKKFLEYDPESALRMLTARSGPAQQHSVEVEVELLRRVLAEEKLTPQLDIHTLAHLIVRIGEAFLYSGQVGGTKPDIDKAVAAIRILVSAEKQRPTNRKRRKSSTS